MDKMLEREGTGDLNDHMVGQVQGGLRDLSENQDDTLAVQERHARQEGATSRRTLSMLDTLNSNSNAGAEPDDIAEVVDQLKLRRERLEEKLKLMRSKREVRRERIVRLNEQRLEEFFYVTKLREEQRRLGREMNQTDERVRVLLKELESYM